MNKHCNVNGCAGTVGRHGAKGYCSKHYKRLRATGSAHTVKRVPDGSTALQTLQFYGWKVTPSGCWEYLGTRSDEGCGQVVVDRKQNRAHRAAYESWVGPIPEGHLIRHSCDNRPCINPDHLLTGLPRDNSQDAVERQRMANGERHPMHKLTDEDVCNIRGEYEATVITQRALARKYGCSQAQISNILLKRQRRSDTHQVAA